MFQTLYCNWAGATKMTAKISEQNHHNQLIPICLICKYNSGWKYLNDFIPSHSSTQILCQYFNRLFLVLELLRCNEVRYTIITYTCTYIHVVTSYRVCVFRRSFGLWHTIKERKPVPRFHRYKRMHVYMCNVVLIDSGVPIITCINLRNTQYWWSFQGIHLLRTLDSGRN